MTVTRRPPRSRLINYDPCRQLLAAVVLQVVRDLNGARVNPQDRESARIFLTGEEGLAWLQTFGISRPKAHEFINNNC